MSVDTNSDIVTSYGLIRRHNITYLSFLQYTNHGVLPIRNTQLNNTHSSKMALPNPNQVFYSASWFIALQQNYCSQKP